MNKRKKKKRHLACYYCLYDKHNKWPVPTAKEAKNEVLQWISRCRFLKNHSPEKLIGKQIRLIDRIDADKIRKKTEQWQNNYNNLKIFLEKNSAGLQQCFRPVRDQIVQLVCETQKSREKHT